MTGIPEPVSFNPLKHHVNEILAFLTNSSGEMINLLISSINHNNVDLYSGSYTSTRICNMVIEKLENSGLLDQDNYFTWLAEGGGHQFVELNDKSVWILLEGDDENRFVHIHPAKFGAYSLRFRGSSLKTIYRILSYPDLKAPKLQLEIVNKARQEIGLSPVKRLVPGKGIVRCWEVFSGFRESTLIRKD